MTQDRTDLHPEDPTSADAQLEATVDAPAVAPDGPDSDSDASRKSSPSASGGRDQPAARRLEPGARVGRYLVVECIGEGAMGQVYAAYDPELDRKVALKILRMGTGTSSGSSTDGASHSPGSATQTSQSGAAKRLLREAKALSQLAHPNVVAVFDVGTLGEEVFVAMEFVAGTDLRQWCREKQRSWREVLDVFVQAGRGLAAAHAAGLVHRDFKPQNAILGADGRVRVLDFGLATPRSASRIAHAAAAVLDQPLRRTGSNSDGWERLTQTGALLGTPAFMAPEVIQGMPADERSDQFSFSVSVFQGLFGCLPFEGRTLREIGDSIQAGRIKDPHTSSVPAWLRRAVLRGLSSEPKRRFPSMEAMLTVLERRDPATRRKIWVVRSVATVAAVMLAATGISQVANRGARMCTGAERFLTNTWDAPRKDVVHAALVGTGVAYAPDTWSRVQSNLDGYTNAWVAMHEDSCAATHVRGEQSDHMLDLRMRCLKKRLGEVKALVDVLARADAEVVQKAVPAVGSLVPVSRCADEEALLAAVPPPTDPQVRAQVEAVQERLEDVRALERTGKFADAQERVQPLEKEARALNHPPLLADVLLLNGILLSDRGKFADSVAVLEEAALVGSRSRYAQATALAERELVYVVGYSLQRFDEALVRAGDAERTMLLTGLFDTLGDRLLASRGLVLLRKGEPVKAIEQQQRAFDLCTRNNPAEQCSSMTLNLGNALYQAGRLDESQVRTREAIAMMEKVLGPTHPNLGKAMNNYGLLLTDVGKLDEALEWLRRALDVYQQALDKQHPSVADTLNNIGNAQWGMGDFPAALASHQQALDIRLKAFGPRHNSVGSSHVNLGAVLEELGQTAAAHEHYQQCLEIKTQALGAEHHGTGWCHSYLGSVLLKEGKLDLAETHLNKAMNIWTKALGPNHPNLYEPLITLSRVAQTRHDPSRARALLERALQIMINNKVENKFTVVAHWELAKVLWATPASRAEASTHAGTALEIVGRISGKHGELKQLITAWMEQHKP